MFVGSGLVVGELWEAFQNTGVAAAGACAGGRGQSLLFRILEKQLLFFRFFSVTNVIVLMRVMLSQIPAEPDGSRFSTAAGDVGPQEPSHSPLTTPERYNSSLT